MTESLSPRRSLWSEEEVEILPDGFLRMKFFDDEEEQPLLLQSTARLLRCLYPTLGLQEIHDYEVKTIIEPAGAPPTPAEDDDVEMEDADGCPAKYQCYQELKRLENIGTLANLALQDIQQFRHRAGTKQSRGRRFRSDVKIQALEKQQQRLLQMRSESNVSNLSDEMMECEGDDDSVDEKDDVEKSQAIRMVRTVNSIRALYPHLLPMLHHKRRNDKDLVIRKTRYKAKKKGTMCWLLGAVGFDVSTTKAARKLHMDAGIILEGFIAIDLAQRIVDDPMGCADFWTPSGWIHQLQMRCNPEIPNPIDLLSTKIGKSPEDVLEVALKCDEGSVDQRPAYSTDNDQHYQRAVSKLHRRLSNILTKSFQGARLSVYGSCLSNLSLGAGSDVDLSLWIPAADDLKRGFDDGSIGADEYSRNMTKLVHQANRKLKFMQSEFRNMVAITRARIPVITGTFVFADNPYTEDGSIDFDICFLNDIAVANSGLLREYSLVDPRVRTLMMSVKQWAKEFGINSAKDNHISSYTWMNLVVFYLQCIRFLPNLQSPALMEAVGLVPDPNDNYWHFVNNLDTCTLSWDAVRKANVWIMPSELDYVPLPALLYGFFEFYGFRFPWTSAVSIKQGDIVVSKLATGKVCAFFSIEDPFETYDSHCPHDLGTPCSENGSSYIMHCLRDAERHLKGVLSGDGANTEKLWPKGPALEPEPKAVNTKQQQVWKSFDNPGRKSDKGTDNGKSTPKKSAQGGRPRSKQGGGAPGNEKRSPIKESKGDDDRSKQQGGQSQKQGKPKKDQQQQKKGQEGGSNKKSGSTGKRRGGRNYRRGGRGGQPPSGGTAETNHW